MIVIAHAGHWALQAAQFAPVFAVALFAAWKTYGDRVRRRRETAG